MKQLLVAALLLSSFALVGGSASVSRLCPGIVPPNDMRIPVLGTRSGGLSETEFNAVMDKMDAYYKPLLSARGKTYDLKRLWTDDTVNASATEQGNDFVVNMYGGLARYPIMTTDGMTLVACHETGHHLGGAPKFGGSDGGGGNPFPFPLPFPIPGGGGGNSWAAVEGGADYYASLNCMHFIFGSDDNVAWVKAHDVDVVAKTTCQSVYSNANDAALCMRTAAAGQVLADIFQGLSKETTAPNFQTPDTSIVTTTFEDHPHTQCRMDTYYQAALCVHDIHQDQSDTDYKVGTCIDYNKTGARPRCWFHPSASLQASPLAQAY